MVGVPQASSALAAPLPENEFKGNLERESFLVMNTTRQLDQRDALRGLAHVRDVSAPNLHSKVDGCVPHTQLVNLLIVCERVETDTTMAVKSGALNGLAHVGEV